jgi:ABC-type antimicrobial peptide transport system permease subunit
MLYKPFDAVLEGPANPFIRFAGDDALLARAVVATIKDMAPELSVTAQTIETSRQRLLESLERLRALIVLICGIAMSLAAIGIYGVVAYAVSQRVRELGIRIALGGQNLDIYRAVLGSRARSVGIGLSIGLLLAVIAAVAAGRVFRGGPFTLHSLQDPATYGLTALLMTFLALAAMLIPARRATRVDPMEVLRYE